MEVEDPRNIAQVTLSGRVKKIAAFISNLITRHAGVHLLKIIEWSLST